MKQRRRTVALIRVSTGRQDVRVQRQEIEAWSRAPHGSPIAEWFEERAVSGVAARRPELERLLADARKGRIGVLVVSALDRVGRNGRDIVNRLHELHGLGVRVVSLREQLDFSTPVGALVASVLGFIAEIERDSLRARTRAGLEAARRRGKTLGRPALVFRPEEIEELRQLRRDGKSWAEIAASDFRVFSRTGHAVRPSERTMRDALARSRGSGTRKSRRHRSIA